MTADSGLTWRGRPIETLADNDLRQATVEQESHLNMFEAASPRRRAAMSPYIPRTLRNLTALDIERAHRVNQPESP